MPMGVVKTCSNASARLDPGMEPESASRLGLGSLGLNDRDRQGVGSSRKRKPARTGCMSRIGRCVLVVFPLVASVATFWPSASASAASYSSMLKRYPYVSELVGNSATVNWATDRSQASGSVTWGSVANGACTPSSLVTANKVVISVGSTSEYQWTAPLVFPGPGTYCYRVQLAGADLLGPDPSPQVKTAAAPGTPFSFAVVGDFGYTSTGEANVMSQIGASPASFVVSTGDSDNTGGSDTDYGDLTQGNVFPSSYLPKIGSRPIFAAQGNHGFTTNLPYLQNFPAPIAAQSSGGRNLQESYCCISTMSGAQNYASSWYAFDWGGARFYVLEAAWADGQGGYQGDFLAHWNGAVSGCGPCGAELTWLKSDLAAHSSTPIKFAFFHYPLYADNGGEPSDNYLDGVNRLEGLLADNNVDIVFNGHAHQYERNLPQIPGKPLVSYVTGAGGAALGSVSGCSGFDAYAIGTGSSCNAPKPTSDAHVYEFLLVTVNGNQVTVTPTDSTGRTFDVQTYTYSGSGTAPSPPPPPPPPPPPLPPSPPPPPSSSPTTPQHGYWLVGGDGGIFNFGSAQFYGSTGSMRLQRPVVGITLTQTHGGYWLVASDGGIFSFGNAGFYGSIPGLGFLPAGTPGNVKRLNAPVVGMVPSNDGGGYFMVASDGGVFAFGDAKFEGSCPAIGGCSGSAVAVMPDATGNGYWLVTNTGHVYSFGDAIYYGGPGPQGIVTSAVRTPDGKGYWILFGNGTVFPFGDAANFGGLSGGVAGVLNPAMAIFSTADGGGYWVSTANGAVYPLGGAPNDGGMAGNHLNASIIAAVGW